MARVDILLVLAHPDDESFVGGGTLCRYGQAGYRTGLICMTDGQAGRLGPRGEPAIVARSELGRRRREEVRRAAEVLGVHELVTPGWEDGGLAEVGDEAGTAFLAREIRRLRPRVIISFGPEGGGSGHTDHQAVSRWSTAAFTKAAEPTGRGPYSESTHSAAKLYWITWPGVLDALRGISGAEITTSIELGSRIVARKRRAFAEHATQQDFREIFDTLLDGFSGHEFYHLARSRVGRSDGIEDDILARVPTGERSPPS